MTCEDIFKAIGNSDDKYVNEIVSYLSSDKSVKSDDMTLSFDSSNERTIVMDVVRKKKRKRKSVWIIAAVIAAAAVAVTAAFLGARKDKKEYNEKKIENYFRSTDIELPSKISFIENLTGGPECCWFSAFMYDASGKPFACVYDMKDKRVRNIDMTGCEGTASYSYIGNNSLYIAFYDDAMKEKLYRFDRKTLKCDGCIELPSDNYAVSVTENEDSTFTVSQYILTDGEISSMFETTYDRKMEKISSKEFVDKSLMTEGTLFRGYLPCESGGYCAFYQDSSNEIDMLTYDDDGNLVFSKENVFSSMPGEFSAIFLSDEEKPVAASFEHQKNGSEIMYFTEIDPETGETVQMYESQSSLLTNFGGFLSLNGKDKPHDGYDFKITENGKLYGYTLDTDEVTELFDPGECQDERMSGSTCECIDGNELLLCGFDMSENEAGSYLCKADKDGNIVQRCKLDDCGIRQIRPQTDGTVVYLFSSYDENGESFNIGRLGTDNAFTFVTLQKEMYTDSFISDKSGKTAVGTVTSSIVFFDNEGAELKCFETDANWMPMFFASGDECYTVYTVKDGKTVVRKLDFDKLTISDPVCELDFNIDNVYDGYDDYDAVFKMSDGLYGFRLSNGSIKEIINWTDSDIAKSQEYTALINNDIIITRQSSPRYDTGCKFTRLERVTGSELEKIQNRPLLNVAVSNQSEGLRTAVSRFNMENENIRIHIEDYSKYNADGLRYIGTGENSKLKEDVLTGNVPDVIITDDGFDFLRYSESGILSDLKSFMDDDIDFDRGKYFENILDAYSLNGKQYTVPLEFSIKTLSGKKSDEYDALSLGYDRFFSQETKLFENNQSEYLKALFIAGKMSEFCDFEKKTCSFENENFIKLIEMIKKYSTPEESTEDDRVNISEGKILFTPYVIYSFEDFSVNKQIFRGVETCMYGIPGENSSDYIISSQLAASVFSSCKHKTEAWEFIKYLMTDTSQNDLVFINNEYINGFPVSRDVYEQLGKKEKSKISNVHTTDIYGKTIKLRSISNAELEELTGIISSASLSSSGDSTAFGIVNEQLEIYLSDGQSAEETAKNIQNKVTMYLNEIR